MQVLDGVLDPDLFGSWGMRDFYSFCSALLCDIKILCIPCWKTSTDEMEKCIFPVNYIGHWFNQDSLDSIRFYADLFDPNAT